jgi:capsular exopolysaccharide synthesis family protein
MSDSNRTQEAEAESLPIASPDTPPGEVDGEQIRMSSDPRGQLAEQFRNLRNSIVALNPDGAPRTIAIASAVAGEGKTVASINLAISLAELPGNQVLVLDGNMHDPMLEHYLGMPRCKGFADVLRGGCSLDAAVRHTSLPGVSVMGAGSLPENSSRLLGSERTRVIFNQLKQRFSYILIDTPEALSISDASLLGALADGILLVVRLGETPKLLVEQANHQLASLGGNILGTCLLGGL